MQKINQDEILEKIKKIDKELENLEKYRFKKLLEIELQLQKEYKKIEKNYNKQIFLINQMYEKK